MNLRTAGDTTEVLLSKIPFPHTTPPGAPRWFTSDYKRPLYLKDWVFKEVFTFFSRQAFYHQYATQRALVNSKVVTVAAFQWTIG